MPRKFYCKMQIGEFAIGFCHSKKMYNVTIFFCDLTNVRSKLLLLGHLPNLVGHCPMSDSNFQPCHEITKLDFFDLIHLTFIIALFITLLPYCEYSSSSYILTKLKNGLT
jgi:hypothetical protein